MAANIGQMFYVGETPWPWLGVRLPQLATLDEALQAAGLDWEVDLVPITLFDRPGVKVPQRVAVIRTDRLPPADSSVLGVVHPKFKPLQNREGAAVFDSLLGEGGRHYCTGGYLNNGERVWLQAPLPDPIMVGPGDRLNTYLLYSNSHDGSQAIDFRLTTVRVVCNNMLTFALGDSTHSAALRRSHNRTGRALAVDVNEFFSWLSERQQAIEQAMRMLSRTPHDDAAFERFLAKLFPVPAEPNPSSATRSSIKGHETRKERILERRAAVAAVRSNGLPARGPLHPEIPPAPTTLWGSLNSVTAWVDHAAPDQGDWFAYTMFGDGDRIKSKAYGLALLEAGIE